MVKTRTRKGVFPSDIEGHLKTFATGLKYLFKPRMTVRYPEVFQDFGPNYRGMLKLYIERCISCTQCARICPSNAMKMYKTDAKKYPGVTYQRCIFCGFCVDICPVDALEMSGVHDAAQYSLEEQVMNPKDLSLGPQIEEPYNKVIPRLDEKRGLKYERT